MKKQYVTDSEGKNVAVLLPIKEYNKIIEDLDELNCIRAYDKAKSRKNKQFKPAIEVFKRIDRKKKTA